MVFENPKGLPPIHGHDHAIHFIQGSVPPNIKPYLMGRHLKVKMDHDIFKYLLELTSEEQQKWVTKMLGDYFEIIYKKGEKNVVADAFPRKDEGVEALFCAIFIIQLNWINEEKDEWNNDEEVQEIIQNF